VAAPKGSVIGAGIVGAVLVVVLLRGGPADQRAPLDPRSDAPQGTSAMVALLEGVGAEVDLSTGLPGPEDDVALLLDDRLDEAQATALERWVRGGGTLVVTDPQSILTPVLVDQEDPLDPDPLDPGLCTIDALDGVGTVDGGAAFRYATDGADASCFGSSGAAFVVQGAQGSGVLVAVGGAAFLTNELLDERDNAVLAVSLLAPEATTTVRVVDAPLPAGGGDASLSDLIGGGVRRAGLQLAIAFVVYALWRAIRVGKPVPDDQLVEIAGSELVSATGRLLERTRAPAAAAEVLRGGLRRSLRARFGVPHEAPNTTLAEVVASRTGTDLEQMRVAVGDDPVGSDAELVTVARAVAAVHQEVLRP
jgi:hypothetical protein